MGFRFKSLLAFFTAIGLASPVVANITPTRVTGGEEPDVDAWTSIIMEREHVAMKVSPAACVVRGTYWLRNPKRARIEEIAYPHDIRFPDDLKNFRAWVDDKPVRVRTKMFDEEAEKRTEERKYKKWLADCAKGKRMPPWVSVGSRPHFEAWQAWYVKFAAGANRKIAVAYEAFPRGDYDSPFDDVLTPKRPDGSMDEGDTALMRLVEGRDVEANYLVFTGGRWNEKIKRGVFEAEISTPPHWSLSVKPKPTSVHGRKYTWVRANFEPTWADNLNQITFKFHPHSLSNNDKANIYKNLSLRHLNEFDFVAKTTNALAELGYKRDAETLRLQSLKHWKPGDFKHLWRPHEDVTAPRELDGALLMAAQSVCSFDSYNVPEQATRCAKTLESIVNAAVKDGYARDTIVSETEERSKSTKEVCLKYGVDLTKP